MNFLRQFQHLLPTGAAWRITIQKTLRKFFEGLTGAPADAREFIDGVYEQLAPETTDELAEWERQFGLDGTGDEATRRTALSAAWQATGGQSPRYLQDILQAAGFDVYVHEWWSAGPPIWVARDPRDYADPALVGEVQCGEVVAQCGEDLAECSDLLAADADYLVNDDLSRRAPPPLPSDPERWQHFFYVGGETFPDTATVPSERRAEFRRMLLKYKPTHLWIVLRIEYVEETFNVIVGPDDVVVGADVVVVTNG